MNLALHIQIIHQSLMFITKFWWNGKSENERFLEMFLSQSHRTFRNRKYLDKCVTVVRQGNYSFNFWYSLSDYHFLSRVCVADYPSKSRLCLSCLSLDFRINMHGILLWRQVHHVQLPVQTKQVLKFCSN